MLTKLIFSVAALIASLSRAWLALTATGMIHGRVPRVTIENRGDLGVSGGLELRNESGDFHIWHDGRILIEH